MSQITEAISTAIIDIMKNKQSTFLSTLTCSLQTKVTSDVSTLATNGLKILINEDFFLGLTREERCFVMAHETLHVAYDHIGRTIEGSYDPQIYNVAADYVINAFLKESGFDMPKMGLYDPQYCGMSTEEVYDALEKSGLSNKEANNELQGDLQDPSNDPDSEGKTSSELQQEIQSNIIRAAQAADMKEQGTGSSSVPGGVRRYLDQMIAPKVVWQTVLKDFMANLDKQGKTWTRRSRRFPEHYMPGIRKNPTLKKITFAIDTSGSVSTEQFAQFISEVGFVMKSMKPKIIELLQFDHELQAVDIIKSFQDLEQVQFMGHGGTSPEVAIDHFNQSDSHALIMITDGYFNTHSLPHVSRPVIWAIFDNNHFEPPYGQAISLEL